MNAYVASILLSALSLAPAGPKLDPALSAQVEERVSVVRDWAADPILVQAVREANAHERSMSEVQKLNREWEEATGVTPFMRSLIDHPAARRLKELRSSSPEIQEAFLTDAIGANVAITNKTSDFLPGGRAAVPRGLQSRQRRRPHRRAFSRREHPNVFDPCRCAGPRRGKAHRCPARRGERGKAQEQVALTRPAGRIPWKS